MLLTLSTYGGSPRVLKMQLFGGWSPENAIFSACADTKFDQITHLGRKGLQTRKFYFIKENKSDRSLFRFYRTHCVSYVASLDSPERTLTNNT